MSFAARPVSRSRHSARSDKPDGSLIARTSACRSRRSHPPVPCGACNARNIYSNLRRAAHTDRRRVASRRVANTVRRVSSLSLRTASADPAPRRHVINGHHHHHRVARSAIRDPRWSSSSHAKHLPFHLPTSTATG